MMRWLMRVGFALGLVVAVGLVVAAADERKMSKWDVSVLWGKVAFALEGEKTLRLFTEKVEAKDLKKAVVLDFSPAKSSVQIGDYPEFFTWLGEFRGLKRLDLSDTGIAATPALMAALRNMQYLQKLDLSKNPLFEGETSTASLTDIWGSLPKLNELMLTQTGGSVENYGSLALLTHLDTLGLGRNPQLCQLSLLHRVQSWAGKGCVAALEVANAPLSHLDLTGDKIVEDPLAYLPLETLQWLSLEDNELSSLSIPNKRDLPQLEFLNVGGNPDLVMDNGFASDFRLKALVTFAYDQRATIPAHLQQRFARKDATSAAASAPSPPISKANPPPSTASARDVPRDPATTIVVGNTNEPLIPKTAEEMRAWLTGADSVLQQAAWSSLQQGARENKAEAFHWLGQAYHKGWNTRRDWVKAWQYYEKASRAGEQNAALSSEALAWEAANLAQTWVNTGKRPERAQLALDLFAAVADSNDTGKVNAQAQLARLKSLQLMH